jgi:hypothetical protein
MKKQRITFGSDITGIDSDVFITQLPDGWVHSRSEEGWARYLHWMTGRTVEFWTDREGKITRYLWGR